MKKPFFILMSILILSGCYHEDSYDNSDYNSQETDDVQIPTTQQAPRNESMKLSADSYSGRAMSTSNMVEQDQTTKVITTANLSMEVADLESFEENLKALLQEHSAEVNNQSRNDSDRRIDAYFTIRVPEDKFEALFEALKPYAKKVESQSLNQQDVTEQFIDVETRLKKQKGLGSSVFRAFETSQECERYSEYRKTT